MELLNAQYYHFDAALNIVVNEIEQKLMFNRFAKNHLLDVSALSVMQQSCQVKNKKPKSKVLKGEGLLPSDIVKTL